MFWIFLEIAASCMLMLLLLHFRFAFLYKVVDQVYMDMVRLLNITKNILLNQYIVLFWCIISINRHIKGSFGNGGFLCHWSCVGTSQSKTSKNTIVFGVSVFRPSFFAISRWLVHNGLDAGYFRIYCLYFTDYSCLEFFSVLAKNIWNFSEGGIKITLIFDWF